MPLPVCSVRTSHSNKSRRSCRWICFLLSLSRLIQAARVVRNVSLMLLSLRCLRIHLRSVYRGHTPHASPGRMSAMRTEVNRLTALLSKMGFPQIRWVVADS